MGQILSGCLFCFLLIERQPLNRNSHYFKRIFFLGGGVVLPLDTVIFDKKNHSGSIQYCYE